MDLDVSKDITALLCEWNSGNAAALNELAPLVYDELRRLATRELRRERPGHTLQSTALVHEVYLKLVEQNRVHWQNRQHFFATAAHVIRNILVSYARSHNSSKRGGGCTKLVFDESMTPADGRPVDLEKLDDSLEVLARIDPQQERIIELRFFGGLSINETAEVLGISTSTVTRDWNLARAWLHREMNGTTAHAT